MTPDSDLLRKYGEQGDEAAFAEVVRRHTDLVYSAALRVVGDGALAQDVTQAAFTKLVRQAQSLCGHPTPIGWLHTTARNAAISAVRSDARRRTRENEALLMQNIAALPDAQWEQLRPILDEAVSQLRERDRQAVLLRFFNGLSHAEVGVVLGLTENSAQKCVDRALEKLRTYFARRGVTVSSALLATAMSANSVQAAPVGLAGNIAKASLVGTSGGAAGFGSTLLAILFMSTKTKVILVMTVILIIAAAVVIKLQSPDEPAAVQNPLAVPISAPKLVAANEPKTTPALASVVVPTTSMTTKSPSPALPATTVPAVADANSGGLPVGPKTDLKSAITAGIQFLNNGNTLNFLKTLMPATMANEESGQSLEDFVAKIQQNPATTQKLNNMLDALNAIQDLTPSMNVDQTRATFSLNPPVGGHKAIIFNKVNGFWYLDGM